MLVEQIQFIGLNDIEEVDQEMVKKLASECYGKIRRSLHNITSLVIHIKSHSKGGARPKYSLHIRAVAPTRIFETETSDWDLARALHKVFDDILREIQHAFHEDRTTKRPRHELV
jgi:hypothetical protein